VRAGWAGQFAKIAPCGRLRDVGDDSDQVNGRASGDESRPVGDRPFSERTFTTSELPDTPTRSFRIAASSWTEAPRELLNAGDDLDEPVEYKRRIGRWLLWRAGPPVGRARYVALPEGASEVLTFELDGRTGLGIGADGREHRRFRSWKESLRDHEPGSFIAPNHPHEWPGEYTYCPHCATELETVEVYDHLRRRCPSCGFIHWRNPGVGAAVVVFNDDGRVLMVRRGPGATRSGYWSIPAGFVDYGEEIRTAAARELAEETGLEADVGDVIHVASNFHDPNKLTVGVWFAGTVTGGALAAGDDADEVGWFALDDLPPLAFETDEALFERLRDER
jgi:8-oxo-dGTP diphosphatase